jgi:hypothetical protein
MSPSADTCPSTRTCPNSDPGFNKIIGDRTPTERSWLFILCVLVRATLYSGVYKYRENPWMPWVVGLLASLSIYQLTRPSPDRQWWSKKFQLIMAILVLLSALSVKFSGTDPTSMPALLFISLLGGVLQRIHIDMC